MSDFDTRGRRLNEVFNPDQAPSAWVVSESVFSVLGARSPEVSKKNLAVECVRTQLPIKLSEFEAKTGLEILESGKRAIVQAFESKARSVYVLHSSGRLPSDLSWLGVNRARPSVWDESSAQWDKNCDRQEANAGYLLMLFAIVKEACPPDRELRFLRFDELKVLWCCIFGCPQLERMDDIFSRLLRSQGTHVSGSLTLLEAESGGYYAFESLQDRWRLVSSVIDEAELAAMWRV